MSAISVHGELRCLRTRYRGFVFRSRLEARWAVFFDTLGLRWEYEPEGFDLGGVCYLPDFWLPEFETHTGLYVDVKPIGGRPDKARLFARVVRRAILLAEGPPDFQSFTVLACDADQDHAPSEYLAIFRDKPLQNGERRLWAHPEGEVDLASPFEARCYVGARTTLAIHESRAAKFEYDETPDLLP